MLAAAATSLAPYLLKLPARALDWHLPVLFLLLRFVFLSPLLQTFLCSVGSQKELICRRESLVLRLLVLLHWAFATCCHPFQEIPAVNCDDQSASHFLPVMAQLTTLYRINSFKTGPLELGLQLRARVRHLFSLLPSLGQEGGQRSQSRGGRGPTPQPARRPRHYTSL